MESTELTQSHLKSILNYNKDTGLFTWKISRRNGIKVGNEAGSKSKDGYSQIFISVQSTPKIYRSHRLAWLYTFGRFPKNQLDHVNRDRTDNRISNLREVDNQENMKNKTIQENNTSGFNGVHWHKRSKKWIAVITVNGKTIHLGNYKDKNEAICARLHANRLYKFHVNHGKIL